MKDSKKQNRFLQVLRWFARIWSILSLAFLLLFFGSSIFSSIGTILAWKWEGPGGIIAIGSIISFHLQMLFTHENLDFSLVIELLAAPGILFILYWLLSRKRITK